MNPLSALYRPEGRRKVRRQGGPRSTVDLLGADSPTRALQVQTGKHVNSKRHKVWPPRLEHKEGTSPRPTTS